MEENSLTIAILKEIRDNTARTNDRVDHLTEEVRGHGDLLRTMTAVQIRQELMLQRLDAKLELHGEILTRLVTLSERHEEGIKSLIRVTDRISDRIDHVYEGPLTLTLRDHESRLRRLEGREQ